METETTNAVAAPADVVASQKSKKRRKALPTIERRRVLAGEHKKQGAPKLQVVGLHVHRFKGPFTRSDVFDRNGQTISMLTIKKRIDELIAAGQLVKMARSLVNLDGHCGRRPERFNFDTTQGEVKKKRARKAKTVAAEVVAPSEPVAPAPAPAVEVPPAPEAAPAAPIVPAPAEPAAV